MIFLKINCPNFSRLVWRRQPNFRLVWRPPYLRYRFRRHCTGVGWRLVTHSSSDLLHERYRPKPRRPLFVRSSLHACTTVTRCCLASLTAVSGVFMLFKALQYSLLLVLDVVSTSRPSRATSLAASGTTYWII